MITANEARKIMSAQVNNAKEDVQFEYALKVIDTMIKDTAELGGHNVVFPIKVLVRNMWTEQLKEAVKSALIEELNTNGFILKEFIISKPDKEDTKYFEISW